MASGGNHLHREKRQPSASDWEKSKDDFDRFYIHEGKPLHEAQAEIQRLHGFQTSRTSWQTKISEWGFGKNISAETMQYIVRVVDQRDGEGKATNVFFKNIEVKRQRIENFKSKGTQKRAASRAIPPHVRFETPIPDDGFSLEETSDQGTAYHSLTTKAPSSSLDHASSQTQDGKNTGFSNTREQVARETSWAITKSRSTGQGLSVTSTPSEIAGYTPGLKRKRDRTSGETCEELVEFDSKRSTVTRTSPECPEVEGEEDAWLLFPCVSETENDIPANLCPSEVSILGYVDEWLSDKHRPRSLLHFSHELGDHGDGITHHHKAIVEELSEFEGAWNETPSQDHCFEGGQLEVQIYSGGLRPALEINGDTNFRSEATLEQLFSLEAALLEQHRKHGEFGLPTLLKHFELAKALEEIGYHHEAEYHCRRALDRCCHTEAEVFLGIMLVNLGRVEESMTLMLRALTSFIIQFGTNSLNENVLLFEAIEVLYGILIYLREQDDRALSVCWCQLATTLGAASSNENMVQTHPQLFIHGFTLAHEASLLGLVEGADWMYYYLLQHCAVYLDAVGHALQKTTGHQRYAAVLRMQNQWQSSAHQLILACESARNSAIVAGRLYDELESDCNKLLPHLSGDLEERLRRSLDLIRPEMGMTRLNVYFRSDLPINFVRPELSALSQLDRFAATPGVVNPVMLAYPVSQPNQFHPPSSVVGTASEGKESTVIASSASTSGRGSNGIGLTFSDSEFSCTYNYKKEAHYEELKRNGIRC